LSGASERRLDLAEFARRDLGGYSRVNEYFATKLQKIIEYDDLIWVHDYHLIPIADALRRRGYFPARSVSPTGGADLAAEP
jgi:trehalose-6-phosphate synthase